MYKYLLVLFLLLFVQENFILAQNNNTDSTSFKIPISQSGVYKIDINYLKKIGIDPKKVSSIAVFAGPNGMLPQKNNNGLSLPTLQNCSIFQVGLTDKIFDSNDFILFFANGPNEIIPQLDGSINHSTHLYDKVNYVFLVINGKAGLPINQQKPITISNQTTFNWADKLLFHENEKVSLIGNSGRQWVGEVFNQIGINFKVELKNAIPNTPILLNANVVGKTLDNRTTISAIVDNSLKTTVQSDYVSDYKYGERGAPVNLKSTFNKTLEEYINLKFNTDQAQTAYLDWWQIQYKKTLKIEDTEHFFNLNSSQKPIAVYNLESSTKIEVWDITMPAKPIMLNVIQNNNSFIFADSTKNIVKQYVAFDPSKVQVPQKGILLKPDNLIPKPNTSFLIITSNSFIPAAQQLANFKETKENLNTQIATINTIYDQFASGKTDPTAIRNYIRYIWQKTNKSLKYVLLLGDANFDIKNNDEDINATKKMANYIPSYQSKESLDNVKSYSSDDYYGFLEENEGIWAETNDDNDNHTLDVAIGRIPAKSLIEANLVISKIIKYNQNAQKNGNWKRKIALTADDGDNNLHQNDNEDIDKLIIGLESNFSTEKIYVDAFLRNPNGQNGILSPGTSNKIKQKFYEGCLIFNYIGHGSPANLSDEKILTRENMADWQNEQTLPIMFTATCEFGRYDDEKVLSGAEIAILNPLGGGIALLTTTRPVYSITNKAINEAFFKSLINYSKKSKQVRLGDLMIATKNNSWESVFNRNFTLLGDPTLLLPLATQKINLTQKIDSLSALENFKYTGHILNENNQINTTFDGELTYKIFDKNSTQKTIGNNSNNAMIFEDNNNLLMMGKVEVKKGVFEIVNTLPKTIDFKWGKGRIDMYAQDFTTKIEADGTFKNIFIGGSLAQNNTDKDGPKIKILNNKNELKNGQKLSKLEELSISILDESAINLNKNAAAKSFELIIDDKDIYQLADLFTPKVGLKGAGEAQISFPLLALGKHKIQINASDIYNNSTTTSLAIEIESNNTIEITTITFAPNPMLSETYISFNNPLINKQTECKITFINNLGQKLNEINYNFNYAPSQPKFLVNKSNIIGKLPFSNSIITVNIQIRDIDTNKTAFGSGKLMLLE